MTGDIHPRHPSDDALSQQNDYESSMDLPEDDEFDLSPERCDDVSRVHSDDELEGVIKELLHNSKQIDASDITVTVQHCDVRLAGTVKTQDERDYAERVIKLVHGVGEISSELVVKINPGILPTDVGRNPN
jgi:hypothetical protein